ncbi:unnamed protein product [Rotaria sp. Silwood2]|nr:unnamed protein product [Rotaria sp. Silwood2]CAF4599173.1 unnamed protein product [Rotaria sp. Silwood2]
MALTSIETDSAPIILGNVSVNFENTPMSPHKKLKKWIVVWLNTTLNRQQEIDEYSSELQYSNQTSIQLFSDSDKCADFVLNVYDENVCLILSTTDSETLLPVIHDWPQLKFFYILGEIKNLNVSWTKTWKKVKGLFANINLICDQLKQDIRQSEYDLASISIVSPSTSGENNELDSSFMYSQLLKDTILNMHYDAKAKEEFIDYLRKQYADNSSTLISVNKFEQNYCPQSSILWFTREPFIYEKVNHALRTQDSDIIVLMGFFIHDLHYEIKRLHDQNQLSQVKFVYRGQGLSESDFERLKRNKGGLLSFNNFLSTSVNEQVSQLFASSSADAEGLVGIKFRIEIEPSMSSPPFTTIKQASQFPDEEEILFSMHTVFRVSDIEQIDNKMWQVKLTLTNESDERLKQVTEYIRLEIENGSADKSLGSLLLRMGKFDSAKKIYEKILQSISNDDYRTQIDLLNMLGLIELSKCNYDAALVFYQKILNLWPLPSGYSDLNFDFVYSNIAMIYKSMENYVQAEEFFRIVIESREASSSCKPTDLGAAYSNFAVINNLLGRHTIAGKYFEKSLEIFECYLPSAHPDLSMLYNNIGMINHAIGERAIALQYFEKALKVQEKSLPHTHPALATQ